VRASGCGWLCLGLLATDPAAGAADGTDPQALARTRQELRAALVAPPTSDGADTQLRAVIDSPQFVALTPAEQHAALAAAAPLALRLKQPARAQQLAVRATALPEQGIDDWTTRLGAAMQLDDTRDALTCILTLGERWGSAGVQPASWAVYWVARAAHLAHLDAQRTQMLSLLFDLRWTAGDGSEPSGLWRELTLALLDQGDKARAEEVAAHVADPYEIIAMRADRRYLPIRKSPLIERDMLKAAERELAARRTAAAAAPRSLARIAAVMRSLRSLGRDREAIDEAEQVQHRIDGAADAAPYEDVAGQLPWILDGRAYALADTGRFDEGIAGLRHACQLATPKDPSTCINLAGALVGLGRPAEALEALPGSDTALSPHGKVVVAMVRAGAAGERGDKAALEAMLAYLREHEADGPAQLERALLMAGRTDEAAAVLLARLNAPDWRTEALVDLQDYQLVPAEPEAAAGWRAAWRALRERADVRRLIAATGTIERYPLRERGF
jgi:hypothetical protein